MVALTKNITLTGEHEGYHVHQCWAVEHLADSWTRWWLFSPCWPTNIVLAVNMQVHRAERKDIMFITFCLRVGLCFQHDQLLAHGVLAVDHSTNAGTDYQKFKPPFCLQRVHLQRARKVGATIRFPKCSLRRQAPASPPTTDTERDGQEKREPCENQMILPPEDGLIHVLLLCKHKLTNNKATKELP